jgi:hypothetical protein
MAQVWRHVAMKRLTANCKHLRLSVISRVEGKGGAVTRPPVGAHSGPPPPTTTDEETTTGCTGTIALLYGTGRVVER